MQTTCYTSGKTPIELNNNSRIMIVGTSGSGKTTLAARLSQILHIHHIELDALYWKLNWQGTEILEFRSRIEQAISNTKAFVITGNYGQVQDLTWGNSRLIIWLNYSRWVTMLRIIRRTIVRTIHRQELWGGNRESLRKGFLSSESIILYAWQTHAGRIRKYTKLSRSNEYGVEHFIILKRPRHARNLLRELIGKVSSEA